jgi:hypothetical protein
MMINCPPAVSIINRMSTRGNRIAKTLLKLVGSLLLVFALLVAAGLTYSTEHGYMTWWFRSNASVSVNGVRSGYLHHNWERSAVIITRVDVHPRQSYLVGLSRKDVIHCGDWQAPQFPVFSLGDVNPPCSFFSSGSDAPMADDALPSTLTARPGFVEFYTVKGMKVTASW